MIDVGGCLVINLSLSRHFSQKKPIHMERGVEKRPRKETVCQLFQITIKATTCDSLCAGIRVCVAVCDAVCRTVCCSVYCSVSHSVLQCVAVCVTKKSNPNQGNYLRRLLRRYTCVCCSVCCSVSHSVLQCVAVCVTVIPTIC